MTEERKGRERGETQDSVGGYAGPTYYDVRQGAAHLEETYPVRVSFDFRPEHITRRWAGAGIWIRAIAYSRYNTEFEFATAGCAMGGNAGARTAPAAMMRALYDLEEAIVERAQEEYERSLVSPA